MTNGNGPECPRCGGTAFISAFISLRCPLCGEYVFMKDAPEGASWREYKLSQQYRKGGWGLMDIIEPPAWFLEHVI